MHFKRFLFLFVALIFALYCASFSVFAAEVSTKFTFNSMTLKSFITLDSWGYPVATETKNMAGIPYLDGYTFPFVINGAYDSNVPGDYVAGQFAFDGSFSDSISPDYSYQYVRLSFAFTVSLASGFDFGSIDPNVFAEQCWLDLHIGSTFSRFDSFTITPLDQNTYDISFYGEFNSNSFPFDYLSVDGGELQIPVSYLDKYMSSSPDDLSVFNIGDLTLYYIPTYIGSGGSGGGTGGDIGGDTGGGSDTSNTIIVSRLDALETILCDIGADVNDVKSTIVLQNQIISELPGNIADELADKDLGTLPEADHHEDEIGQVEDLEDQFYDVVDDFKENISSSMNTANTVIRDNTDNISSGSGLFLTRVFDLSFVRTIVLVSLSFGFIGYLFRLGGKVL